MGLGLVEVSKILQVVVVVVVVGMFLLLLMGVMVMMWLSLVVVIRQVRLVWSEWMGQWLMRLRLGVLQETGGHHWRLTDR